MVMMFRRCVWFREGYMLKKTKLIGIIVGLRTIKGNQCRLDAVYDELMTGLKGGRGAQGSD